jgi:hypothetical protein
VPTIAATAIAPTATTSPASGLLGPEWSIAAFGDSNGDGSFDVIGYRPVAITPRVASAEYPIVASEIVIVQRNAAGQPELQFAANQREVFVPGRQIAGFAANNLPAAYQVRFATGTPIPIAIIPLTATGEIYAPGAGITWDGAAYQATNLPIPQPASSINAATLVGSEWNIAGQADLNGNGRRDLIAYKAIGVTPKQPDPAYPLVISEAVIVEEGLLGRSELQFAMNSQQVIVPGATLARYPDQVRPSAFQAAIATSGQVIRFIPLDQNGQGQTRGAQVVWDGSGYRLNGEAIPQPRALVGSEWTIAAEGDLNQDGRRDVLAYKPGGIVPRQPANGYRIVTTEIVIVQENVTGPYGAPDLQLALNTRQFYAPNQSFAALPTSVAAFQLAIGPGGGTVVNLIAINSNGETIAGQSYGFSWDRASSSYRLQVVQPTATPGTPTIPAPTVVAPTATPQAKIPLVGNEWAILLDGDSNGDGRRDVIAIKPSALRPRTSDAAMPQIVQELVIVQQGANGTPELLLAINAASVIVPNQVLATYATPASAFQVGLVTGATTTIIFQPLNSAGDPLTGRTTLAWNASVGRFQPR